MSLGEEIANAITHGIGAILSIAALIVLIIYGQGITTVGLVVYGATLILLYLASTLYHSLIFTRAAKLFRKFDHMAIFLLIAGTYTPFCLLALEGWVGFAILAAVWILALMGIVMKSLFTGRYEWLSVTAYIATGWLVILAIKPLHAALTSQGFTLLVAGGVAYTIGTIFYVNKRIPYSHSIWHLWVMGGSTLHFFAVLSLL